MKLQSAALLAAAGAAALVGWYVWRNGITGTAAALTGAAGEAAVGAVLGTGDLLGIPRTDTSQCQRDTASGNTWDASFSCSAGDFARYVMYGTATPNTGGAEGSW